MRLPIYQVDAFSGKVFSGNPAAVCPLDEWLADETMQAVAAENNLAETAFFMPKSDDSLTSGKYHLRWFTPKVEVDLCGHATLASAYVIFEQLGFSGNRIEFASRSGVLPVEREENRFVLDFPAQKLEKVEPPELLLEGLNGGSDSGKIPQTVFGAMDYLVVFPEESDIAELRPDSGLLAKLDRRGVIVTAPGREADFVSRFFAPSHGLPEDSVTGSAHCALVPYWAERLGKSVLFARQISQRGGELFCENKGLRSRIAGECALYLQGNIFIGA